MRNFSLKLLLLLGLTFGLSSCLSNDDDKDKDINLNNKQLAGTIWKGESYFEIDGKEGSGSADFQFFDEESIKYSYVHKVSTSATHPQASYVAQKNTITVDNVYYRTMLLVKKFTRDSLILKSGDVIIRLKRER
ncbi:hypothetical protein ACQ1PL_05430 [Ornithobacterium rhinotracheale]